jgi:hypothetical protein
MAHYCFLNKHNIVTEVIVGKDENEGEYDWEFYYSSKRGQKCVRTSYNTRGGEHILGGTPFRKNYAGIGYTYDEERDAFIPPKPFESWVLNEDTCLWEAPVPMPEDAGTGEPPIMYTWDEETTNWVVVERTA